MRTYLRDRLSRERFVDLYVRHNLSLKQIATMYGCSVATLTRLKKDYGIATRPAAVYAEKRRKGLIWKLKRSGDRMKMRGDIKKLLSKDFLKKLYCEDKRSLQDIGKIFGCSRAYVMKLCKEHGIERRSKAAARVEAMRQGKLPDRPYYEIDESFFARWSPASAYVFGLLVTDGHIGLAGSGTYVVILALNDRKLLEKVRRLLSSSHPIRRSKQQPRLHVFQFARERMTQDLLRLGLTPRKSLTIKFPHMPQQFRRHFIRGCWDGDGSVYLARRGERRLRASFVSGSRDFIRTLEQVLQEDAGLTKRTIYQRSKSYYFRYGHRDAERLFHYLYDDVPSNMYLQRKYQKFAEEIPLALTRRGR